MNMEPSTLGAIATPQAHRSHDESYDNQGSPKRCYQYQIRSSSENMQAYTTGDKKVHEYVQRRGRTDTEIEYRSGMSSTGMSNTPREQKEHSQEYRVSTGSTGSSENGELGDVLRRRRQLVDTQGAHWESRALDKSSNAQGDTVVPTTLFAESTSTPPRPAPVEDSVASDEKYQENEYELRTTPPRRRRSSRQKLLEAATARLKNLSDEQLTSLTVLMGSAKTEESSCCSSSERSSEDSPPKARATSAPAGNRSEFYEATPPYPELRKKRLSGQRPTTPMKVRFEGEEQPSADKNGSDDEDVPRTTSSIGLKAARRLSRGPTGEIVPVSHDDSPKKTEETRSLERNPSESEFSLGSAVVGGATGAVCGGVAGAAVGLVPALFTFGLSIPICAIGGATYQGYKGIVNNLNRNREDASESSSSHVRTSSEPPISARW